MDKGRSNVVGQGSFQNWTDLSLVEDFIVCLTRFTAKVGVAICSVDAFVAGEFLR